MDFLETLKLLLMAVETGALLGALIFSAKGIKEKKHQDVRKSLLMQAAVYFVIYIVLNILRFTVLK